MKFAEPHGTAWAFRQLMLQAKADITSGESKPARILFKRPDLKKTYIGPFKAKLLRMWKQG